jgi:amidohydrolase
VDLQTLDIPNLPPVSAGPEPLLQLLPSLLTGFRRDLHRHPEVGFAEYRTSARIRELLEADGLSVHGPVAHTGLWTDIQGTSPGPAIGFRADIDALPSADAKVVDYASCIPGAGHLCGHDFHTTVAAGTALLLNRLRHRIRGTVRVFFQPNEEGIPSGAPLMMEAGVLDGLGAVYAIHVDPSTPAGRYALISGPATAAADLFDVRIETGRTAHSARPHEAVDSVWVATQIASTIYQLVGRISDARNPAVITICRFEAGKAHNVIPNVVTFGGTIRATADTDRALLRRRIQEVSATTAALHGARAEATFRIGAPPVINHPALTAHFAGTAARLAGAESIVHVARPSMGAEDFGHYTALIPGLMVRVGTASHEHTAHPLHHTLFDVDESTLAPTAMAMAETLIGHLETPLL